MKELKLGIIGFGFMGKWHYNHAGKLDNIKVTAVCDIDPDKLSAAEEGVSVYTDYHALLEDPNVETVMISVPNYLHRQVAVAAANARKNIIVEKPVAMNVEEFDAIEEAARRNCVIFTIHQNRRWDKDYLIVKKAFRENLLGKVFHIQSSLYGIFGLVHDWHVEKRLGGGMMYDWGVHLIDQLLDLIPGKVTSVSADIRTIVNREVDDYYRLLFHFEDGHTACIELGTYLLKPVPRWYVAGENGTLSIDNFLGEGTIYRSSGLLEKLPEQPANVDSGPTRTFSTKPDGIVFTEALPEAAGEWNDFFRNYLQVINNEAELIVKPEQARRVLALMEAAWKASEAGKSVDFE